MDKKDIISLNKRAWDHIAEKYEKANYGTISPIFELFCSYLPKHGLILDLGSGTGLPYDKMFIERGFNVVGIDISSEMIEIARRNVPQAEFTELSMTEIDYENEFDGVFSSYSMLLLDPTSFKDVAKEIVRALKKDGVFYVSLNEPWEEGADVDAEVIVEIMGETMYSRAYIIDDVLDAFTPLGLNLVKFNRHIERSEEFGEEHTVVYLFKKP